MYRLHKAENLCVSGHKNDTVISDTRLYAIPEKKNRSHFCDLFSGQILQNVGFFELCYFWYGFFRCFLL